jgi:hypothetical protein
VHNLDIVYPMFALSNAALASLWVIAGMHVASQGAT